MANCGVCNTSGHNKTRHLINCIICGSEKSIEDVRDAEAVRVQKETYKCDNLDFHKVIRNAWDLRQDEVRRLINPVKS